MSAALQLSLDLPLLASDLSDLAGPIIVEARLRRQRRERVASAVRRTTVCTCGGPSERTEDGELTCVACAKAKP